MQWHNLLKIQGSLILLSRAKQYITILMRVYSQISQTSISKRAESVEKREEFGHWEMDTVVGKKGTKEVLLVLTERKTDKK